MPAKPIIRRIASLKNFGVFRNYTPTADLPDLTQLNLIYGFNGSGKTTLSRVFRCLETTCIPPDFSSGQFEIDLSNGDIIKSDGAFDSLKERVLVFNTDFTDENLRWKEGTANPVFYLGKAQTNLSKKLDDAESKLIQLAAKRSETSNDYTTKERVFVDFKRDVARNIAEQLNLGRKYDATNLVSDFAQGPYSDSLRLEESQRQQLRATINLDAPLPKRPHLSSQALDMATFVRDVTRILQTTLGTVALRDLRQHESMMKWVKEGIDYHQKYELLSCLFCGNTLTTDRISALEKAIDNKFDQLVAEVTALREKADLLHHQIGAIRDAVPSVNDISQNLRTKFTSDSDSLKESLRRCDEIVSVATGLLTRKAASPNVPVEGDNLVKEAEAVWWDLTMAEQIARINKVIENHNNANEQFDQAQAEARNQLKRHFLTENQSRHEELNDAAKAAKSASDEFLAAHSTLAREIESLKQQLRQHGPAAEIINRLIKNYLGHQELEIATLENGYEIRRNGKSMNGSLSEGEKTAIALCYFLSMIEAEGRRPKDLIVVVDDPISSLDTRALNYAFNIIKGALSDASQLIVMTHNLHFMNETKKWLKNKATKEKPEATLLFLDVIQKKVGSDERSANIKPLPRLIRDYESEYHYLFYEILKFSRSDGAEIGHFYLMPNAMRKVLEIFLAFKLPGPDGLGNKIENIAKGDYGVEAARIRALDRLVEIESHGDNLEDLVSFSSMTIEETNDAVKALLHLIETLDKGHYDRMTRICE